MPEEKKAKVGKEAPNAPEEKTSDEIKALKDQIESLQAQKEHFREKAQKAEEGLQELKSKPPTPSDDIDDEIPEWQELDPVRKQEIKERIALKRKSILLEQQLEQATKKLKWEEQFEALGKLYPQIIKRREEFKGFIEGDIPSEKLVKAFLYEEAKEFGAKEEKEKAKREGLETGTSGPKAPTAPGYSEEEIGEMMLKDPKKLQKLVQEGKIK